MKTCLKIGFPEQAVGRFPNGFFVSCYVTALFWAWVLYLTRAATLLRVEKFLGLSRNWPQGWKNGKGLLFTRIRDHGPSPVMCWVTVKKVSNCIILPIKSYNIVKIIIIVVSPVYT